MTTYNADTWAEAWKRGEVRAGDRVTGDLVRAMMDTLPPVSMGADCAQMGEPWSHARDNYGDIRPTWLTWRLFARSWSGPDIADLCGIWEEGATWEFCGACIAGQTLNKHKQFEPTQIELIDETSAGLTEAEANLIRHDARQKAIYWSDDRCCHWMFDFQSAGYWCAGLFFGNGLEELEGVDQFAPIRIRVSD